MAEITVNILCDKRQESLFRSYSASLNRRYKLRFTHSESINESMTARRFSEFMRTIKDACITSLNIISSLIWYKLAIVSNFNSNCYILEKAHKKTARDSDKKELDGVKMENLKGVYLTQHGISYMIFVPRSFGTEAVTFKDSLEDLVRYTSTKAKPLLPPFSRLLKSINDLHSEPQSPLLWVNPKMVSNPIYFSIEYQDTGETHLIISGRGPGLRRQSSKIKVNDPLFYVGIDRQKYKNLHLPGCVILFGTLVDKLPDKPLDLVFFSERSKENLAQYHSKPDFSIYSIHFKYWNDPDIKNLLFKNKSGESGLTFWNCLGPQFESMRQNNLLFGGGGETNSKTILLFCYLVYTHKSGHCELCFFSNGIYDGVDVDRLEATHHEDLYSALKEIHMRDPDLIISYGLKFLEQEGYRDLLEKMKNVRNDGRIKRGHWFAEDELQKHYDISPYTRHREMREVKEFITIFHSKFTISELLFRIDLGYCSIDEEEISHFSQFMRYYRKVLDEVLGHKKSLLSNPFEHAKVKFEDDDRRGGLVIKNQESTMGIVHDVVDVMDFSQYYPSICIMHDVKVGHPDVMRTILSSKMRERENLKSRLIETPDDLILKLKELNTKLFMNKIIGLFKFSFPSQAKLVNETGRKIIYDLMEYLMTKSVTIVCGHTDSVTMTHKRMYTPVKLRSLLDEFVNKRYPILKFEIKRLDSFFYAGGHTYLYLDGTKINGKGLPHQSKGFPPFFKKLFQECLDKHFIYGWNCKKISELAQGMIKGMIEGVSQFSELLDNLSEYHARGFFKITSLLDGDYKEGSLVLLNRMQMRGENIPFTDQPLEVFHVRMINSEEEMLESRQELMENRYLYELSWEYYVKTFFLSPISKYITDVEIPQHFYNLLSNHF